MYKDRGKRVGGTLSLVVSSEEASLEVNLPHFSVASICDWQNFSGNVFQDGAVKSNLLVSVLNEVLSADFD